MGVKKVQIRRIAAEWIQTTSAHSKRKFCFDSPRKGFFIALPEYSHKEFMPEELLGLRL